MEPTEIAMYEERRRLSDRRSSGDRRSSADRRRSTDAKSNPEPKRGKAAPPAGSINEVKALRGVFFSFFMARKNDERNSI
jgi:hypothetical protein